MNHKVRFLTVVVFVLLFASILTAANNGENKFLVVQDVPSSEVPLGLYDVKTLPDLNNNGLPEILTIADNGGSGDGCTAYILERNANNELVTVWQYNHANSYWSYGVAYGDVDNDGWGEVILLASANPGQDGILFFEVDSTMFDSFPLPSEPTLAFDISGAGEGQGVYQAAVANIDTDPENEFIVCDYEKYKFYVLEETGGDIANPVWNYELVVDDFTGAVTSVTTGDLDGDGFYDFAIAARPDAKLRIYENTGDEDTYELRFEADLLAGGYSAFRSLTYYDFNGDYHQELIYPTYDEYGKVFIIDNPGELAAMDASNIHEIAALNGRLTGCVTGNQEFTPSGADGRDIYISDRDNGKLWDIEYTGGDGVTDAVDPNNYTIYTIYSNTGATPRGVAVHAQGTSPDFDGDGRRDIVVVGTGGDSYVHMLEHEPANQLGLHIAYQDPSSADDPNDPVDSNPRGAVGNVDLDQDGKQEIFITEYVGVVHCYEATGEDNTLEWIWSDSLASDYYAGWATPRELTAGDIDGNGRGELYLWTSDNTELHPDSAGLWFYEWDGINDNGFGLSEGVPYAGGPTYIYPQNLIHPDMTKGYTSEYKAAADIDGDGKTEYILPNNGSGADADGCAVLHCVDGFIEDGFPTFKADVWMRSEMGVGGSPWGAKYGDTDGDGNMEAIFMIWDHLTLAFAEYISEDSVEFFLAPQFDTLRGDAVYYDNFGVADLDGDGDDEIIGVTYSGPARVFIINPPAGDLTQVDPYNPNHMTVLSVTGTFGGELGDPNQDGKLDLMIAEYRRSRISALTLEGADPMDPASWTESEAFYDDSWVPKPNIFDYDTTTGTHPTDPAQSEYDYYSYHWNDGVHSLTDGSFAVIELNDYDNDGAKEVWINTIQSPFADSWFVIAEATPTGIKTEKWKVIKPADYKLEDAYPNPFNANCMIKYALPLDKNVTIKIYNMLGQVVKTLVDNKFQTKGNHQILWDGTNNIGNLVSSGNYIYSLEVGKHIRHTKRITLLK